MTAVMAIATDQEVVDIATHLAVIKAIVKLTKPYCNQWGFILLCVPQASKPYKPQAVFRTRQTSGFFMSKFYRSIFLAIKNRFGKLNVERARNTIPERGITPAVLVAVFEPLGTLFR